MRFEFITGAAMNYPSLTLDDDSVPEINCISSFENDDCEWESQGFGRVDNISPRMFVVQIIHQSGGKTTDVRILLEISHQGNLSLNLNRGDRAFLAASGTTLFTTENAYFHLEIK